MWIKVFLMPPLIYTQKLSSLTDSVKCFVYIRNEGEDAVEFNTQVGNGLLWFFFPESEVNIFEILRTLTACIWMLEENCLIFFWNWVEFAHPFLKKIKVAIEHLQGFRNRLILSMRYHLHTVLDVYVVCMFKDTPKEEKLRGSY